MKKFVFVKLIGCGILCTVLFTACSGKGGMEKEQQEAKEEQEISGNEKDSALEALEVSIYGGSERNNASEEQKAAENQKSNQPGTDVEATLPEGMISESGGTISELEGTITEPEGTVTEPEGIITRPEGTVTEPKTSEPVITESDWAEYFDGFHGAAVIYDADALRFNVYNRTLAETRRSPCSTFKIISSLIALKNGVIDPANSTRKWSGEVFWNEKWNNDIDLNSAFRESCVWYFREVIDEIGQETMQEELDALGYGNCDISDWEGKLNTNNNNRALTGFWLESSLVISPKEQTEVMERIFGEASVYPEEVRNKLKEVMLVENREEAGIAVYGKTGMGKAQGITVDAWFTGFAENTGRNVYFCVYLGRTDDKDVTSTAAKEIALRLVSDYYSDAVNEAY